jgi:hypothetical protein
MLRARVSFDYDETLSTPKGRQLAKEAIIQGFDVYVITRRQSSMSGAVYQVADQLGIDRDNVYFTNGQPKWPTIKRLGIAKHYDNSQPELDQIKQNNPGVQTVKLDTGVSIASSYAGEFENLEFEQGPCQEGYVQIGVKDKDGRVVPNCVPEESANK